MQKEEKKATEISLMMNDTILDEIMVVVEASRPSVRFDLTAGIVLCALLATNNNTTHRLVIT